MATPDALQQLTFLLQEEGARIARMWGRRLRQEFPDLTLSARDVRAPLGGHIAELTRLLVERGEDATWLWPEAIRAHGAQRYDQRFEAEDLVRELKALQAVLFQSFAQRYGELTPDAALLIGELVGEASAAVQASFARVLRTEETRFREAALMESVLHHVDFGIVVAEADGAVTYATPPVAKLLGVSVRTLVGNRGPTGLAAVLQRLRAQREDGSPFEAVDLPLVRALRERKPVSDVRMRILRQDGSRAVIEMTATPLFEEDGAREVVGAVQVLADRTDTAERTRELAHANDTLRRLQSRLLQRSRTLALGQLASGTALALDNLLNVLRLRVTLLRREPQMEHVEALDRTVGKVAELMSRLRELASPHWEEERTDLSVREVVHEAIELARPGECAVEPLAGQVHVDAGGFRELLVNLLFAARDRTPEGRRLHVAGRTEGTALWLEIADEGPRFSEEDLARIFDPLASRAPHLALVLAAARDQLHRWDGELLVENRGPDPKVGAVFRVRLPAVAARAETSTAEPRTRPPPPGRRVPRRVLVVDDDPDNASLLAQLLAEEGYEVQVAYDATEAMRRFEAVAFDTVFLDGVLPDRTGWDLARELRTRAPHVQLAMVTGADVSGQNRQTLALVDAVFRKPVDVSALDDFLRRSAPDRGETPSPEGWIGLTH